MPDTLKLCPFCGQPPETLVRDGNQWVWCDKCNYDAFLVFDWQSRPVEDALRKQRDEAVANFKRVSGWNVVAIRAVKGLQNANQELCQSLLDSSGEIALLVMQVAELEYERKALRARVAELEAIERYLERERDEALIKWEYAEKQATALREHVAELEAEVDNLQTNYRERCEQRDLAWEENGILRARVAELEASHE